MRQVSSAGNTEDTPLIYVNSFLLPAPYQLSREAASWPEPAVFACSPSNFRAAGWVLQPLFFVPCNLLLVPLPYSPSVKRSSSAPWLSGSVQPSPVQLPLLPSPRCRRNASAPAADVGQEAGEDDPPSLAPLIPCLMKLTVPDDAEEDAQAKPGPASTASTLLHVLASLFFWPQTRFMSQSRLKNAKMKHKVLLVLLQVSSFQFRQLRLWTSLHYRRLFNLLLPYQIRPRQQQLQGLRKQVQVRLRRMTPPTPTQASQTHTLAGWWKKSLQPLWTTECHLLVSGFQGLLCLMGFNYFFFSSLICKDVAPAMEAQSKVSFDVSAQYVNGGV
jgi:hypothetical protein